MAASSESLDLLEHFRHDAVVTSEYTTHIEYKTGKSPGFRKERFQVRWYRERHIGSGTSGDVWLEVRDNGVEKRAVKVIDKSRMDGLRIDYKKELLALAKFSRLQYQQEEVFVKFVGWFEESSSLFLWMEYFDLGDLEKHIEEPITENDMRDIATNVLNGLRIMHGENFTHRDLKPGNIFVVQKPPAAPWWVKIGDFGISKRVKSDETALRTQTGTPAYQAPEINGYVDTDEPTSVYSNAVDIWSVGCIVYKLATQQIPFPNLGNVAKFCSGSLPFPEEPLRTRLSSMGIEFVKGLIVSNPRQRPSAEIALQSPWLSQRTQRNSNDVPDSPSSHGQYRADSVCSQIIQPRLEMIESGHTDTLQSMSDRAKSLYIQGQYKAAEEIYLQVMKVQENELGPKHPDTLMSMNNLANALNDQGEYKTAERMHQRILELRRKVLGCEHPDTLMSMNNLANTHNNQGQYKTAEKMHREILALRQRILGPEHPDTLRSMNGLAKSLNNQMQYETAERMHREILELRAKVLGSEHPDTLRSMNSLANCLNNQARYEAAEKVHRQILELRVKVLGSKHPDTLRSMNSLANSLNNQGRYEAAEKVHRQILGLRETILGSEHPDTLMTMNNLANSLYNQRRYQEAGVEYQKILELRKRVLGSKHPDTLRTMNGLANALQAQGQYDAAQKIQWLELQEEELISGRLSTS